MDKPSPIEIEPPRMETLSALLIAGLSERYKFGALQGIPAQWRRFVPYIEQIPERVTSATYGVCRGGADGLEYICGVEVSGFNGMPAELTRVRIPPRRYAVFTHRDHLSRLHHTWQAIMNRWLPESGYREANSPEFERYGEEFDPATGNGGLEIWIPIEA